MSDDTTEPFWPSAREKRKKNRRVNWVKYAFLLGKMLDIRLAEKLGISREAVGQQRKKRGIPAKFEADTQPKGINWDKQPLGQKPDAVLAERLGVSHSSVSKARRVRGIERYCVWKANLRKAKLNEYACQRGLKRSIKN